MLRIIRGALHFSTQGKVSLPAEFTILVRIPVMFDSGIHQINDLLF
jgi:hypothetical protein